MDVRLGSKDSLAIILMEAEANGAKFCRAHTVGGQKSPRLLRKRFYTKTHSIHNIIISTLDYKLF